MADHFARFSSMLESARDLTIEAAVSASTRLTETPSAKRPQEISKLLNSRAEREVLSGMKCVIALISRGEDGIPYFADVVKNVTSQNSRVRALVMVYIQKYADREPDTALLSINSIQKSLGDKSPKNRAASIRTLGGIQIPEIASLLILCIKRTVMDPLPIVRAATALAIGKAYEIDGINKKQLSKDLGTLLCDGSPQVVGAAVKVFILLKTTLIQASATKAWQPIHSSFRMYVKMIKDLDSWSKSMMIDLLVEYSRTFLPKPKLTLPDGTRVDLPTEFSGFPKEYTPDYDSDLALFINSLELVGYSDSPQVILSAFKALLLLGTPQHISSFGYHKALMRIAFLSFDSLTRLYSLQCLTVLALAAPELFRGHAHSFFLYGNDAFSIAECKLFILLSLFSDDNGKSIMLELKYNALNQRREIAREAVKAIGRCSQSSTECTDKILRWCVAQTAKASSGPIMAELLTVIRFLLQQSQGSTLNESQLIKTLYKLSLVLSTSEQPIDAEAKSSIVWIIGEFTEATKNTIGPDLLRRSLKSFVEEPEKVRYELLMLAAKSYSYEIRTEGDKTPTSTIGKMFHHIVHLSRYDASFTTRDRVRMLEQLFKDVNNHQLATLFLQVPKPAPVFSTYHNLTSSGLASYLHSPDWADQSTLPPKSIRKEAIQQESRYKGIQNESLPEKTHFTTLAISSDNFSRGFVPPKTQAASRLQSLDEFFGNEESEEEASEEESEQDSTEESDDESEDDTSEDESEDESEEDEEENDEEYLSSEESDASDVALVGETRHSA